MSNSTLIISDIHLGSTLSSAHSVIDFLKKTSFHRLILLGDIFDGIHIYRFKPIEWELLAYLEKLAEQGKDIVWVKGNHDVVDVDKMPNLKNVKFVDSYCWKVGNENYCAFHGHQFDHMSIKNPAIKKVTGTLHSLFAAYMRHKKTASLLDKWHSKYRRLSRKISSGAIEYAKNNEVDYIFCGHTHEAMSLMIEIDEKRKINYFNTGSWIQKPFTYILIDDGGVKIGEFA